MRSMTRLLGLLPLVCLMAAPAWTQTVLGGPLPGPFPLFPSDNWWNLDITAAPVDPHSAALISFIGTSRTLHPDFGGEVSPGSQDIYGFPYIVVDSTETKQTVQFVYSTESDGVDHTTNQSYPFYPIPPESITQDHWIEGGAPGDVDQRSINDRHMLIVDRENKYLYELYNVYYDGTQWNAGSGAFFDMKTDNRRPDGWTSADAAGLAMLPGLVRYDEVYGPDEIGHAFRMTVRATNGYVYPASHNAGSTSSAPPMGARLRLKASKDISGFPADAQKIFRAMKKYGLIVADNGSDMYVSGTFDTNWNNDVLNPAFGGLTAGDFEVVQLGIQTVPQPVVALSAPNYSVSEAGVKATITVKRSGPTSTTLSIDYATSDGTAVAGTGYTATSGTLSFTPGVTLRTFTVPVFNTSTHQGNKTVLLSLKNPVGTLVGAQSTAVLTILDKDLAGTLQFSAAVYRVSETGSTATITVTRAGGAASGVTVNYATSDGSGIAGKDYLATSGTLTFGSSVLSQSFAVKILNDGVVQGDETVGLSLSSPGGGATLGATSTAQLVIASDDSEAQFSTGSYTVAEKGGIATIGVTRSGSAAQPLSVDYATSNGTAIAGTNYVAASGTLTFAAGVLARSFTVAALDDGSVAPSRTVQLTLSNPSGGGLGLNHAAILTILGDDPVLNFTASTYGVTLTQGVATIGVSRTPLTGTVTVNYATSDGTAIGGTDYTPTSGSLTFAPGVGFKTFTIPILKTTGQDVTETVNLALASPAGALLGSRATATLSILGNAVAGTLQFAVSDFSGSEGSASATITVSRLGGTAAGVSVDYATSDGTAVAQTNYVPASGTLVFGQGETTKTFTVGVLDDGVAHGNLTVRLRLQNPTGGGTLGIQNQGTLWIVD
jgi:hypothetical protein